MTADGREDDGGAILGENDGDVKPMPPPESLAMTWTRRRIIIAFWAIVVCLGLPHWIWTTSIHRSSLPLDTMNGWAEGNVSDRELEKQTNADSNRHAKCITQCMFT